MAAQLAALPPLALIPAMQPQVNLIPGLVMQMNAMQLQLTAIQNMLAAINPAGLGATVTANLRASEAARALNRHDRRGVPLAPVPRMDGTLPPSWPPGGFRRDDLIEGLVGPIDMLLADYGLAAGGNVAARRAALARALGTSEL